MHAVQILFLDHGLASINHRLVFPCSVVLFLFPFVSFSFFLFFLVCNQLLLSFFFFFCKKKKRKKEKKKKKKRLLLLYIYIFKDEQMCDIDYSYFHLIMQSVISTF